MEGRGSGSKTTDHESYDLQSRRSRSLNSAASSTRRLSFSLRDGFSSHEGAGNESVSQVRGAEDGELHSSGRLSVFSLPFSAESTTGSGVIPSQLREHVSIGRASSSGASLRRLFSLSGAQRLHLDEDVESEIVSQAGDIGDRALSRRGSLKDDAHISMDEGVVFSIPEELLESYGFWSHDPSKLNTVSPVSPLELEIAPLSTAAILLEKQDERKELSPSFEYIACHIHLAVFGILGGSKSARGDEGLMGPIDQFAMAMIFPSLGEQNEWIYELISSENEDIQFAKYEAESDFCYCTYAGSYQVSTRETVWPQRGRRDK